MVIAVADEHTRYHRQELITWWDQEKLGSARVLIVGAGALGNEVAKNLALVGVGHMTIVDMDYIEHSNLARCVFFRESDEGENKAEVLAREASRLNPDIEVLSVTMPVQRLGAGFLRGFDLAVGALDNREARMWLNQAARKMNLFWIDGAIEGLHGRVRVFGASGPCYECTLSENDYLQLSHRKSCALLAPEEILTGKTPTNATTAGVVAAVQSQEAIKILVGRSDLVGLEGKSWEFIGDSMLTFTTGFREDEFCPAHDCYGELSLAESAQTIDDLVEISSVDVTDIQAIDFEEDLLTFQPCGKCGAGIGWSVFRSAAPLGAGKCSQCGAELPAELCTSLLPGDYRLGLPLQDLGVALKDIITIRTAAERFHFVVYGGGND